MMLQYDWNHSGAEGGADEDSATVNKVVYSSKDVGLMAKLHLKWSLDPLLRVKFFVRDIFSELKELRYREPCTTYPTISIGW
jgi:hypothetical protein